MGVPSTITAATLPGNLAFSDGGVSVNDLLGAFVKSVSEDAGTVTITFQDADGDEQTSTFSTGSGSVTVSTSRRFWWQQRRSSSKS